MVECQPVTHDQPEPEKHRQLGVAEIALQPGGHVEKPVLKHIRCVHPPLEPSVHAQLNHPAQSIAMPLVQVGERVAVAGTEPLEQMHGLARWIVHELAHTL